jgi:hypothetical protein
MKVIHPSAWKGRSPMLAFLTAALSEHIGDLPLAITLVEPDDWRLAKQKR